MSDTITMKFKVLGFIWTGDDQPIAISVSPKQHPDQVLYLQSPDLTQMVHERAAERGISVGEMVDILNADIPQPPALATWQWNSLSQEQYEYPRRPFRGMGFNL